MAEIEDCWLSVDEICKYLGVSKDTVYKWIDKHGMPAHRMGRLWKFKKGLPIHPHGIRYLKKLDKLATNVADWKEFNHHEAFKVQIIEADGCKRSFWSKYEVKK